jgi:hypothetical protein
MNYTSIDEAYSTQHIYNNVYRGNIVYSTECIYCKNNVSLPLMNDGGSLRQCINANCRKIFQAKILSNPIQNYHNSTFHLNGTN